LSFYVNRDPGLKYSSANTLLFFIGKLFGTLISYTLLKSCNMAILLHLL